MYDVRRLKFNILAYVIAFNIIVFFVMYFSLKYYYKQTETLRLKNYKNQLLLLEKSLFNIFNTLENTVSSAMDREKAIRNAKNYCDSIFNTTCKIIKEPEKSFSKTDVLLPFLYDGEKFYITVSKNAIQNYFFKSYRVKTLIPLSCKEKLTGLLCRNFRFRGSKLCLCVKEKRTISITLLLLYATGVLVFILSLTFSMKILELFKKVYITPLECLKKRIGNLSLGESLEFDEINCRAREVKELVHSLKSYSTKIMELSEFKETIEEDATIEEVYERVKTLLIEKFKINKFSIYRVKPEKDRIIPVYVEGKQENTYWCSREIFIDSNVCRAKRTVKIVDSLLEFKNICPYFRGDMLYHVCFPIITGDSVGLILQIVYGEEEKEKLRMHLPEIKKYVKEVAPVLESKILLKSLKETIMRDPLTGIYNRRFLEEFSEHLIQSAKRNNLKYGILMADIDHFKKINDRYGHDVGDFLLKEIVKVFHNTIRRSDLAFRYGGEEFLIILSDIKSADNAKKVAEKIRENVEVERFKTGKLSIENVTISIGVAIYPLHSEDFWLTIKYADIALYRAKKLGRNRVVLFSEGMIDEE